MFGWLDATRQEKTIQKRAFMSNVLSELHPKSA